jgi:uncharacterized protein (DUF1501 family)
LHWTSLVSLYPAVPLAITRLAQAAPAESDAQILVVIQLDGGNDGINTVVPFGDDGYGRNRDVLRLDSAQLHKLNEHVGLHPQMRAAKELFDDGRLTIVQGVGYPNPDRSHFRSMRIWQTARFDDAEHDGYGWLGRALDLDATGPTSTSVPQPGAIYAGPEEVPVALWGRRSEAISLSGVSDMKLPFAADQVFPGGGKAIAAPAGDAGIDLFVTRQLVSAYSAAETFQQQFNSSSKKSSVEYPVQLISRIIKGASPARVFYTVQGGYDTHAAQIYVHAQLLRDFCGALKAFLDDLKDSGLEDRVIVLAFSEFGRRVKENASHGTDHGAAGPVFVAGRPSIGGLTGHTPSLSDLDDGDLKMNVDMRAIYAAILDDWLGIDSASVLGGAFAKAKVLRS